MTKFVYDFAEGNKDLKDLLGGKGANLAEMTNLGLPVPPGFTITTEACRAYLDDRRRARRACATRSTEHLAALEQAMGKQLGEADDPLLVSVRSGAKFSMPGMMETVLNIGLNDESVAGPGRAGRRRAVRLGLLPAADPDVRQDRAATSTASTSRTRSTTAKQAKGTDNDLDLDADDLRDLVDTLQGDRRASTPAATSRRTRASSWTSPIQAVFDSWNADRARCSTAARSASRPTSAPRSTSCAMVFGNLGTDSGTGVAFTRDPATGAAGRLRRLPAERPGRGRRRRHPQHRAAAGPGAASTRRRYDELLAIMATLENHYRDLCDIEFTIERGKLWMLQTRVGKRTAAAAFRIATQLVDEGLIDLDEALHRVTGAQLGAADVPAVRRRRADAELIAKGIAASPGRRGRQGRLRLRHAPSSGRARARRSSWSAGRPTPTTCDGMIAAAGHPDQPRRQDLARRRGRPRHGQDLRLRRRGARRRHRAPRGSPRRGGVGRRRGRRHLDRRHHRRGLPRRGAGRRRRRSCEYFEGTPRPRTTATTLVAAVHRIMTHADAARRLAVRANADNAEDAARARRFGAAGHRAVPHRAHVPRRPARAGRAADPGRRPTTEREAALAALLPLQRDDFVEIFAAMDGLPVTVRLLDPPLHEFLPDLHRAVGAGRASPRSAARTPGTTRRCSRRCAGCTSRTRCWACAACASAWSSPGLFAHAGAGDRRGGGRAARRPGGDPQAGDHGAAGRRGAGAGDRPRGGRSRSSPRSASETGVELDVPDRHDDRAAAGRADRRPDRRGGRVLLLRHQRPDPDGAGASPATTSRRAFFSRYLEKGIFGVSPFESIDRDGVGRLVRIAVEEGRAARPGPQARRLRRARRRPGVGALLPRGRPGLRVLLAVPGAGGPAGGGRAVVADATG